MINIFDLFCGAGGLSWGFNDILKYKILVANDKDKPSLMTYYKNYPNVTTVNCDIKDFNPEKYIIQTKNPTIIIGGPPCQSYSTLGKREIDQKALLYKEYFRIINKIQPFIFLYENVTGVMTMDGGKLFKNIIDIFENIGYVIRYKILNAVDFGIPQTRRRLIIIGTKNDKPFTFPQKLTTKYITLKMAIGDLPSIASGESSDVYGEAFSDYQKKMREGSLSLTMHSASKHNERLLNMISRIKEEGGTAHSLTEEPKPTSGYGNTYARLWWNKPSATITGNLGTPSSSRCIHPSDNRALTSREGARIQSFPDCYEFCGRRQEINQQIGNAVPPILSNYLSKSIYKYIESSY